MALFLSRWAFFGHSSRFVFLNRRGLILTVMLACGALATPASAGTFDEVLPSTFYYVGRDGYYLENPYDNGDTPCALIAAENNTRPAIYESLSNPRYVIHPTFGNGCAYTATDNNGFVYETYKQNWVVPNPLCPSGYNLYRRYDVSPALDVCRIAEPAPACRQTQSQPKACIGNPVMAVNGVKLAAESDQPSGLLDLNRTYRAVVSSNSQAAPGRFGYNWTDTYQRRVTVPNNYNSASLIVASVLRPDGRIVMFGWIQNTWTPELDVKDKLVQLKDASGVTTGWQFTLAADGSVETYDASGKMTTLTARNGQVTTLEYSRFDALTATAPAHQLLTRVTNHFGQVLNFAYDGKGRVITVTETSGGVITYLYDTAKNLSRVNYPDGTAKLYHYENTSFPHHLTGISQVDAAGTATRYATYAYDASGRAISTEHAGGQEKFTLRYDSATQTTVTDAVGNQEVMPLPSTSASRTWSRNVIWPTTKYSPRPLTPTTT